LSNVIVSRLAVADDALKPRSFITRACHSHT